MRRVVVTGLGAVTPLGLGVKRSWERLLNGESGVISVKDRFPQFPALPSTIAGAVPEGRKEDGDWDSKDWLSSSDNRRTAKHTHYAIAACEEALLSASLFPFPSELSSSSGLILGTGIGNLSMLYDTSLTFSTYGHKKVSPHFVPLVLPNLAAGHLSQLHSLRGPISTPSTACTTGLHAIGDAARLVALNDADIMLAGATEACIHPLALAGFSQAKSLSTHFNESPAEASRPFDKARDGFVLSEGAGVMVLEALDHAIARKAPIFAEIAGYGMSADAYHPTAPEPSGRGAEAAMRKAMLKGKIIPAEVGYVNAHATGTVVGDRAENEAIQRVFGAPNTSRERVSVSSFKGAVGHLLGAAGAVEAIWTVMALAKDIIPPTRNLDQLDGDWGFEHVMGKPRERIVDVALTNSFGFGGTNASICIKKYKS